MDIFKKLRNWEKEHERAVESLVHGIQARVNSEVLVFRLHRVA